MENPVLPSSCVTPAGTSIEAQNEREENTHPHTVNRKLLLPYNLCLVNVAAVTVVNSMFFDFYTSSQRRWLFLNLKGDSQGFTRQKKQRDTIFTLYSAREDDF